MEPIARGPVSPNASRKEAVFQAAHVLWSRCGVDVAIVWKVVERHLPTLRQTIESLLRQAD